MSSPEVVPDEIELHDDCYVVCKIGELEEGEEVLTVIRDGALRMVCLPRQLTETWFQRYRREGNKLVRVKDDFETF